MVNAIVLGINGRMGQNVVCSAKKSGMVNIVAGVDVADGITEGITVYSSFDKVKEKADVIIDFSSPKVLSGLLAYAKATGTGIVSATTGYSEEQLSEIKETSKIIPVFRSANYSLGVSLIAELVKKAAAVLKDFDIEIIEKHHNKKKDAPSGTALMLADGIRTTDESLFYVYGRNGNVGERNKKEIGIHAVRGGNIVGEHEVIFAGENEIVTVSHSATSRSVFADGAVRAAQFIADKTSGYYNMTDLVKEVL